eukprot:397094_1
MRVYIFTILSCICVSNAQFNGAFWDETVYECGSVISGKFPEGNDIHSYTSYYRYYKLSLSYPTWLPRDVWINTCIDDRRTNTDPQHMTVEAIPSTKLYDDDDTPYDNGGLNDYLSPSYCDSGEIGRISKWHDVPEGDYFFGIQSLSDGGGAYRAKIMCSDSSMYPIPDDDDFESTNITKPFTYNQTWYDRGEKRISCGVSAYGTVNASEENSNDYYEYEVTDWPQEMVFTTCVPDTTTRYDGTTITAHYLRVYRWDYGDRQWEEIDSNSANSLGCATIELGEARDDDQTARLSPGKYYVNVERWSGIGGAYVLSMACWNNGAVKPATLGTDYTAATYEPTPAPVTITAPPTWATPTANPASTTTLSPSYAPSVSFGGEYSNTRKAIEMDTISCGIYRHDTLERKRSHWYKFEVNTVGLPWYGFDTCKDDATKFNACLQMWYLSTNGDWITWGSSDCSYCNNVYSASSLSARIYAIEIYGQTKETDYGEYIVRMECPEEVVDRPWTVPAGTSEPTPSPTGVAEIPPMDGNIAGDISCGLTITGNTKKRNGDFHKFKVIGGGIEWVKFDTCQATEFKNYLFVYDYYNHTGHEYWAHYNGASGNSLSYHYEDDSTCNALTMNDLTPGTYYVNIDGYNWFFDHGSYTITMTCSDSSAIEGASNYTEFDPGLKWWHILLIILGSLLLIGCIVGAVIYCKKKKASDAGGSSGDQPGSQEMAPPPPPGETQQGYED